MCFKTCNLDLRNSVKKLVISNSRKKRLKKIHRCGFLLVEDSERALPVAVLVVPNPDRKKGSRDRIERASSFKIRFLFVTPPCIIAARAEPPTQRRWPTKLAHDIASEISVLHLVCSIFTGTLTVQGTFEGSSSSLCMCRRKHINCPPKKASGTKSA